jgi:hypothetical protein
LFFSAFFLGLLMEREALHPALMALQYPLLFPFGDKGFYLGTGCFYTRVHLHSLFEMHIKHILKC